MRPGASACALLLLAAACSPRQDAGARGDEELQANEVPVATNSESPFDYPPDLYEQGVEGEVRLRLYVDATGRVHPESTRVAESSGSPRLDSAAVSGAALLRFAPARRHGEPVGLAFYQPVVFRRGAGSAEFR
jgi:protein TonB